MAVMGGRALSPSVLGSERGRWEASCKGVTVAGSGGACHRPPTPLQREGCRSQKGGHIGRN